MKKALLTVAFLLAGCVSPQEIIILPSPGSMLGDPLGGGGSLMPRIEYQCPLCGKQFKTEYLAEQCIDSHE